MTAGRQALILMAGMPGSGKSTVARALGRDLGFPVIDKDVILSALLMAGITEHHAQPAAYQAMIDLGEDLLQQHFSIVLDSPAAFPETVSAAEHICGRASAQLITILCSADRDTRNERVATRPARPSQPIGISKTPGYARDRFTHVPEDAIELDTMHSLDGVTRQALKAIRARIEVVP